MALTIILTIFFVLCIPLAVNKCNQPTKESGPQGTWISRRRCFTGTENHQRNKRAVRILSRYLFNCYNMLVKIIIWYSVKNNFTLIRLFRYRIMNINYIISSWKGII